MSGFTIVTLTNGNQFFVREPLSVQTDPHGFLYIVEKEVVKNAYGQVQYVVRETYNPHAWVSYKWQDYEEKKD